MTGFERDVGLGLLRFRRVWEDEHLSGLIRRASGRVWLNKH